MDRDVGGVGRFIKLNVNVFFVDRLEVAGAGQAEETSFERAVIDGVAFAQGNSAAHVAVAEFVQAEKLDPLHEVWRRVAQIECYASGVSLGIESSHYIHGMSGEEIESRVSRSYLINGFVAAKPQVGRNGIRRKLMILLSLHWF